VNGGYLDADCVIRNLVKLGFIHANPQWKHNTRELYYTALFQIVNTRASIVSFEITVVDGIHRVPESTVRAHEKTFNKNFSNVFTECKIA